MDKQQKKKGNKNASSRKPAKDTFYTSEKPVKAQKPPSNSVKPQTVESPLPNVQSKEVILTGYDHLQPFSKRKLESNWGKYDDLPDEEDNEQLLAASFEEMLLGPKAVGGVFTFSSEKHWDALENSDNNLTSQANNDKYFKLDLNMLKKGIGSLPFDLRMGYSEDIFNAEEIRDMTNRVGCFDRFVNKNAVPLGLKEKVDLVEEFQNIDAKAASGTGQVKLDKPNVEGSGLSSRSHGKNEEDLVVGSSSGETVKVENKTGFSTAKGPPVIAVAPQNIENIQGWLDDILNNG